MRQLALYHERRVHVAIMRPSWGLLEKVVSGQKTVEIRCSKAKIAPWGRIEAGDEIYFKNSGQPVALRAEVADVQQLEGLNPKEMRNLLDKYANQAGFLPSEIGRYFKQFFRKHYCLVIFLKNPIPIRPFEIDKHGFGSRAAWLTVPDIEKIKRVKIVQSKLLF